MLIVYFYERDAAGSNITSVGDALWWAAVTVSTVGYGDMYPVTWAGRATAAGIMAIGILTLAVVTAQVSASYVEQSGRRRGAAGKRDAGADGTPDVEPGGCTAAGSVAAGYTAGDTAMIEERLARIESVLLELREGQIQEP